MEPKKRSVGASERDEFLRAAWRSIVAAGVGAERIVWGSDTLLLSSGQQIGKVLFADLPDQAKLDIVGLNAARIFGLADHTQ